MRAFKGCLFSLAIMIQGIAVGILFRVENPCTESGIGCDSVWEMLHDSWSWWYSVFSLLVGIILLFTYLTTDSKEDGK